MKSAFPARMSDRRRSLLFFQHLCCGLKVRHMNKIQYSRTLSWPRLLAEGKHCEQRLVEMFRFCSKTVVRASSLTDSLGNQILEPGLKAAIAGPLCPDGIRFRLHGGRLIELRREGDSVGAEDLRGDGVLKRRWLRLLFPADSLQLHRRTVRPGFDFDLTGGSGFDSEP